jgi:hypothetical protein
MVSKDIVDFLLKPGNKRKYLICIGIVVLVLGVLSFKIMWDIETLKIAKDNSVEQMIHTKWNRVESYLDEIQGENYLCSEELSKGIIKDLIVYSNDELENGLMTLGLSNTNIIQKAVGNHIKGVYFRNIESDANDPFAMVIGKEGEKDSFIFSDFSENCAINSMTRSIEDEYKMHSNKELAKVAFKSLITLKYGRPIQDTIFFQFEDKKGAKLTSNDFNGIKQSFFDNKGDLYLTFNSLEFLAPYYIYRDRDITGKSRIEGRVRTDARILAIVSVCSPYEVILHDKEIYFELSQYDNSIENINTVYYGQERFLLITGILVLLLQLISFVAFWIVIESTNKRGMDGEFT